MDTREVLPPEVKLAFDAIIAANGVIEPYYGVICQTAETPYWGNFTRRFQLSIRAARAAAAFHEEMEQVKLAMAKLGDGA